MCTPIEDPLLLLGQCYRAVASAVLGISRGAVPLHDIYLLLRALHISRICIPAHLLLSTTIGTSCWRLADLQAGWMSDDLTRFTLRWAVDISAWSPNDPEWQFLLGLLPGDERAAVQRFKFRDDQKRALLSRSTIASTAM